MILSLPWVPKNICSLLAVCCAAKVKVNVNLVHAGVTFMLVDGTSLVVSPTKANAAENEVVALTHADMV
jgi:hypothetical protein